MGFLRIVATLYLFDHFTDPSQSCRTDCKAQFHTRSSVRSQLQELVALIAFSRIRLVDAVCSNIRQQLNGSSSYLPTGCAFLEDDCLTSAQLIALNDVKRTSSVSYFNNAMTRLRVSVALVGPCHATPATYHSSTTGYIAINLMHCWWSSVWQWFD